MRIRFIVLATTAALLLLLGGCRVEKEPAETRAQTEAADNKATAAVTAPATRNRQIAVASTATTTIPPTASATETQPRATAQPTLTPTNRPSATFTATPIPSPTINVTATVAALAAADQVDRNCPDPAPGKPEYQHFYLSATRWQVPEAIPETHFWFDKPLPGAGRWLYTDWLPYGYDAGGRYLLHNGIDSAEPEGTPVLAVADGTVVVAGEDSTRLYGWRCDWYGHLVVVELDDRWRQQPVYVLYGHVLNIKVRPGERVSRGQEVAEVGFGGAAKLPHLHFEVRVGSNEFSATRNPLLWVAPPATRGIIAGRLVDPDGRPWQGVTVTAVARSKGAETRTTWTYLGDALHVANGDESLAENFVLADLKPGEYELYVELQGEIYTLPVVVKGGQLATAEIVTLPLKVVTPGPEAGVANGSP